MRVCTKCGRTSDIAVATCPACQGALVTSVDGATEGSAALAIDPDEELATGTKVGDYQIDKLIGVGGMGVVYGAVHPVIGKRAAIKVLNARFCADHESVQRFVTEAQAVNRIGHANIVDIFSIGELPDGRSYLVMEWLQGETLMDRIERGPLPLAQTIAILIALTRALEAAHNAGVIHRDLKPENVFLVPEDETFRVKLLDFGIAKLETVRTHTRKTATGMTVGTPLYMSPEQAKGIAIDGRTDIYSLGILAYAMVCRATPFENEDSPVEVLHAHISKAPRPPRELAPAVPHALDALILQMLAKTAGERPPLAEIRDRLKRLDDGGFETFSSETPAPRASHSSTVDVRARRRSPLPWIAGFGVIAAGLAAYLATREPTTEDAAPPATATPTPATPVAPAPPPPEPAPPAAPAPGTLELVVEPAAAKVTIDGEPVALDAGRARIELPEGEHVVASTAAGYRDFERSVAISSNTVTPLSIELSRARTNVKRQQKKQRKQRKQADVDGVVDPFGRKTR